MLNRLLELVSRFGPLSAIGSRLAIQYFASRTTPRPRPYSLWSEVPKPEPPDVQGPVSEYTCWPVLTDRSFSSRHLAPADPGYTQSLPADAPYDPVQQKSGQVTALFERHGPMKPDRSSILFAFFAQWFTDSVLRVHPIDRRMNTSNHDIDLCQIYGQTEATARILRSGVGGTLQSQVVQGQELPDYLFEADGAGGWRVRNRYRNLPYAGHVAQIFALVPPARWGKMYATGLERGNSSIGYVAVSTIFLREHNRLCRELAQRNPVWDDERLFQTARMINIVLLLKLIVEDYINHILGHKLFRLDTSFAEGERWYRPNWIALEFDLLYRWHSLVPDGIEIKGTNYGEADFRNNNALLEQAGVGAVIDAASRQHAGRIGVANTPSFLWGAEYQAVKMGRDFRLRSYNEYRERFQLKKLQSFGELTRDPALSAKLAGLYGSIDKLEYLVGVFAEDREPPSLFGELLTRMVAYDAFTQIFTNPLLAKEIHNERTFTRYGMQQIEQTKSTDDLVKRNLPPGSQVKASLGV